MQDRPWQTEAFKAISAEIEAKQKERLEELRQIFPEGTVVEYNHGSAMVDARVIRVRAAHWTEPALFVAGTTSQYYVSASRITRILSVPTGSR